MNKVVLTGNLVKECELRYTNNQKAVMQNTIAVRNDYKNANGEYESQFINIEIWGKTAEFLNQYAGKGSRVLVEGKIVNRNYTAQDGTKRYVTNVAVEKVELLETRKQKSIEKATNSKTEQVAEEPKVDPFEEFANEVEITEEDLPF